MSCQECSLCGFLTPDLKSHIGHLRSVHKDDPSFYITCGLGRCCEQFTKFSAYNTHIYRKHRGEVGLSQKDIAPITNQLPEINVQGATELVNDFESQQEIGDDEQDHMDDSGIFETSAHGELQDMEDHHDNRK